MSKSNLSRRAVLASLAASPVAMEFLRSAIAEAAQSSLSQILPQVVDHLTPDGRVPQGDLISKGMELLKGKLFSSTVGPSTSRS